jgi:hypothetical protein
VQAAMLPQAAPGRQHFHHGRPVNARRCNRVLPGG